MHNQAENFSNDGSLSLLPVVDRCKSLGYFIEKLMPSLEFHDIDEGKDIEPSSMEVDMYEQQDEPSEQQLSDFQRLQFANNYCKAAYLEVMTLAKEAGTWIRAKPGLVIPDIPASEMVTIMMHVKNKWSKSMFPLVKHGEVYRVVECLQNLSKTDASIWGAIQVYAEIQLPTTLVPTRYFEFLRYGKEIMDGVHIIVDVTSHCFGDPYARYNSEKRPSGVIIREYGRKDCEIIWIENVEVEETRETMYSSIINSNLAYNADRWISTLLWKLKRDRSCFPGLKIDVHPRAGSFLLALTQAMKRFFMECVSQHPDEVALTIATSDADPIRIMYNQTLTERIALVGVNSFRVQAKPLSVFHFLTKMDLQLAFRASANSEIDEVHEEPEQLFTFASDDKSNIISLHKRNTEQRGENKMEDEAEIYDGIRAQFPLTFGKQQKSQTSLEAVHNATRRSTASKNSDNKTDEALPSVSSSSNIV
ncbi:hypothetical protein V6N11_059842 [Hibiscus sabdariffa]|uniref:Uncharacterized protein n=2 Tax=Hibiscus sabdariffa TaxID=183260 RepID=A0ABR2BG40_9ROSI